MSDADKKSDEWAGYSWGKEESSPETTETVEEPSPPMPPTIDREPETAPQGFFEPTVEVPAIPSAKLLDESQLDAANIAEPIMPPSERKVKPRLQVPASGPAQASKKPAKRRKRRSSKVLVIVGLFFALNAGAVAAFLYSQSREPELLSAEIIDSDEYADEDSLRIEIPLDPQAPETAEVEDGVEVDPNLMPLQIVITDGQIVLQGTARSEEQADQMATEAVAVFGEEVPLVREYTVNTSAPTPNTGVVVQKPVVFEPGSAVIRDEFKPLLDACAEIIEQNPTLVMNVSGHTDSDGSAEYNLDLAERRAQAVIDYYESSGLNPDNFVLNPIGEDAPIDSNTTEDGRESNRRTDLEFEGVFGDVVEESETE